MEKSIFYGSGVALITPMNNDGSVNYEKLKELVDWQIENKTDAIIACGTTGESATLTEKEKIKVIEEVVKTANSRIPIIAGTGSNNTKTTIEMSKEAKEKNVDGILVVTPYYNKASQQGLVKHYEAIANNVDIPVIVYDVPSRTGCKIEIETFEKLKKHKNIVGVKAASGNISEIATLASVAEDYLTIFSGNDDQITPIMSLGGVGVISVIANILPKETHDICTLYLDGQCEKSTKLQLNLLDLMHAMFIEVNPIPVKTAMNLMNKDVGPCRMPLCELDNSKLEILKNCLQKHNLI